MQVSEFVAQNVITASCIRVRQNPYISDSGNWAADHYEVTLTRHVKPNDRYSKELTLTTYFSKGIGHKGKTPSASEVLDSLILDASACNSDFEDWAADLGYSPDSRKAFATYEACKVNARALRDFLGADLMQVLSDCERL